MHSFHHWHHMHFISELIEQLTSSEKNITCILLLKAFSCALAGVAQWIECGPVNQRVTGSIPNQGTCLGCRPHLQWGACERQPHIDVSLSPSLLLSLKINKILKNKNKIGAFTWAATLNTNRFCFWATLRVLMIQSPPNLWETFSSITPGISTEHNLRLSLFLC